MKQSHIPLRLLAFLLALSCLFGPLATAALATGAAAPGTITLADYTVNGMGFNSGSLGFCRFHRIDFNYGGEIKTAFCAEHGMSMAAALAGHSWGRPQSVTNPTITTLMAYFYAHTSGDFTDQARAMGLDETWNEERTWMMNAWVQAAVWRFKAGTLGNPVVACAEELIPIYNRLKGTSCTSIDDSMGDSTFREFTQLVLDLGEQGVWGECSVYEYDYTDAGTHEYWADYVQSVMIGALNITHEVYSLIVKKVDATNPTLTLPGARFRVVSADGSFSRDFLTGQDGTYTLDNLAAGTYTVTELEAPEGYQISQAVQYVTLPGTERTVTVTFEDTPDITGTGSIRKVDSDNPARGLAGAVIKIEGVDNDFVGTYVTGAGGYLADVPWETMPLGSYTATEVTPPAGYALSSDANKVKQSFRWDGRSDVTLVFENDARVKVQLIKLDDSGRPLPGAVFNILKDGQLIGTEATKADGTITVTDVTEGLYAFVEVSAPAPYACLTEPVIVHVDQADIIGGGTVTVTAVDKKLPSLQVVKYDRQSGQSMSGITFEIFRDTVSLGRFQTDGNGEIILSHVEPGTYLVQEVATDDEHVVDSTPQQIRLEAGQTETAQLVFFNSLKPGIHLIKVDSVTMKSLPNVRFEFKLVGGSYRQEFVTDINGEIDLSRLEPGAYQVRELEAPEGYLIDDAVRVIKINPDETASFVFTNTPRPSLRLIKTSSDGSRLAGVQFRIARIEDGAHYLDRITDTNGEINISGLEPGVYSVKETATVSDHVLDSKEYHVELFPGQTSTLVVENQKRPNLIVYKYDADTGEPVPNTVFLVKAADGHSVDEIKTDSEGKATLTNLLPGVYEVSEKSVPSPWLMDADPQFVTLYPNRDHTVYFENHKKPTLTVKKVDSITGSPIQGAKFQVWYGSNSTITGELNDLGTFYTDDNGQFFIDGLHDGWYRVTELEAADGYELPDEAAQSFYLGAGESKTIIVNVNADLKL